VGVGLRNTRERLELLYGDDHEFAFRGAPGLGCEVAMSIPLAVSQAPAPRIAAAVPSGRAVTAARRVRSA
jgi:signal transduction histidine kinase